MSTITIFDGNEDDEYTACLQGITDFKYFQIINPRECGIELAFEFFDPDYLEDLTTDEIYDKIEEKLNYISFLICEEVINILKDNGVEIKY